MAERQEQVHSGVSGTPRPLGLGDVIVARFPEHDPRGHEQQGLRPAIVAGLPELVGPPRYPTFLVVPATTHKGQTWALAAPGLYPVLPAGAGGLPQASVILLEQVRGLDAVRVLRRLGTLTPQQFRPIVVGLQGIQGLSP